MTEPRIPASAAEVAVRTPVPKSEASARRGLSIAEVLNRPAGESADAPPKLEKHSPNLLADDASRAAPVQPAPRIPVDMDEFAFGAASSSKVALSPKASEPTAAAHVVPHGALRVGNLWRAALIGLLGLPILVLALFLLSRSPEEAPAPPPASTAPDAAGAPSASQSVAVSEECGNSFAYASVHTDALQRTTELCGSAGEWEAAASEHPNALGGTAPSQSLQAVCASTPQAAACAAPQ